MRAHVKIPTKSIRANMAAQQRHDGLRHDVVSAMDNESIKTIVNSLVQKSTTQETILATLSRRVKFTTPPSMLQNSNRSTNGGGGLTTTQPSRPTSATPVVGNIGSHVPSDTASLILSRQRRTPYIYHTAQQEFSARFNGSSARRLGGGSATLASPTRPRSASSWATFLWRKVKTAKMKIFILIAL